MSTMKFKTAAEYAKYATQETMTTGAFEAPDPVEFAQTHAGIPSVSPHAASEPTLASALTMIAEALQALKQNQGEGESTTRLSAIEAFLMSQAQARPHENLFNPPLVSQLNPLGERDHPRPELRARMFWVGYELAKDSLTKAEIDLLNRVQPGAYRVTKSDGRSIPFKVIAREAENGSIESLAFHFPCKGPEDRQNHAPMTSYLREVLGEAHSVDALLAEVAALKARPVTYEPVQSAA